MKRLVRRADDLYKTIFKNLGKDGRKLLKEIENYKYKITQSLNMVNDEKINKKIQKYVDDLNNMSAFCYSFVFDMENYNIVDDNYNKQIEFSAPKEEELEESWEAENIDNTSNDNQIDDIQNNEEEEMDDENKEEDEETDDNEFEEENNEENIDELFDKANENDEKLEEE